MSNSKIIVIGAGGHAQACIDVIEEEGKFKIFGLIGLKSELGNIISGYEVIGTDDDLPELSNQVHFAAIGIGQIASPDEKMRSYENAISFGYKLPAIISPNAYVSKKSYIEQGTIIMHGAIVNAGVKIGSNCIINSSALLEHGVVIENHCHIATGAILNGEVYIEEGSFIGSRAVILQGARLKNKSFIKMGQIVT